MHREHQPYIGRLTPTDLITQNNWRIGGSSPVVEQEMANMHGRSLSGIDPSGATGYDPRYQDQLPYELEYEDDVDGSGIFDAEGREATANADMGVFASHYSLPGFASREVAFQVNPDITDVTDGAPVVGVPAGMNYVEHHGDLACIREAGCQREPYDSTLQPAPLTGQFQPYAYLGRGTVYNPAAQAAPVPMNYPTGIQRYSTAQATQISVPVGRAYQAVSPAAPDLPIGGVVPYRNTANAGFTRSVPISGLGMSDSTSSTLKIAFFGALLGAAGALFAKAMGYKIPYIG